MAIARVAPKMRRSKADIVTRLPAWRIAGQVACGIVGVWGREAGTKRARNAPRRSAGGNVPRVPKFRWRRWGWTLVLALTALACSPPVAEDGARTLEPLETEEVGAAIDAELSIADDAEGRRVADRSAGVLPSGLPPGLPLPDAYSVIGFSEPGERPRYVELVVPRTVERLRRDWLAALRGAGWAVSGSGADVTAKKAGHRLAIRMHPAESASRLRIEY